MNNVNIDYAEYVIEYAYKLIDYTNSVANSNSIFIPVYKNKIRLNKLKNIFNI